MHSTQQTSAASAGAQSHGASSRKAETNRANAQHSTGPKTEAGKAASSQNATRHSILSSTATLLAQPNEEIQQLLGSYRTSFRPTDAHEDFLVSEVAVADWRVKHISRIEQGVMFYMMEATHSHLVASDKADHWAATHPLACPNCGHASHSGPREPMPEPPSLAEASPEFQTVMMGSAWVNNEKAFALLHRYQTQARRDYYKAVKQLELVRTGKAGYLPKEQSGAQTAADETKPTDPGYVLKWDVPEFVCYDPNYLETLARPTKRAVKQDDDGFVKVNPRK